MSALSSLFSPSAVVVEAPIRRVDDLLWDEELAYVRSAVPKRRAEFGTARVCAREALGRLGLAPVALVPGSDRAPVWPRGVVGSITHTQDDCAVVLHRSPPMQSVGVDVEMLNGLDEELFATVLTARERSWTISHGRERREDLAALLFSAKEAYYKCQYPLSRTFLDFHDVEIEVDLDTKRFVALAQKVVPTSVQGLVGRFAFDAGRVYCGMELAG
jgi:phosphopantetheine--protein transferase-like protein